MSAIHGRRQLQIAFLSAIVGLFALMSVLLTAGDSGNLPDQRVKVIDFYPQGVIGRPTNINIKFSNDLVPDDSLNKVTTELPFIIEPPISGLARWIDNDKLRFFPDTMYAPSTIYKIEFKSEQAYLNGNRIDESRIFEFSTPVLIVKEVDAYVENVPRKGSFIRLVVYIEFIYAVRYDDLIAHLATNLRPGGEALTFSSDDSPVSEKFRLVSNEFDRRPVEGTRYEIMIKKDLPCVGGQIPMQADFKRDFGIERPDPLVIESVRPEEAGANGRITLQLSHGTELVELQEHLTITPAVKLTFDQRYDRHVFIYGNFKPREVYTIDIEAGMQATNGRILDRAFSNKVQMPDLRPSLRFMDDGFYMAKGNNKLLAIETVNISEISVEVEQIFVNNIVYYLSGDSRYYYGSDLRQTGRRIFAADYAIPSVLNEPLTSKFNLAEVIGDTLSEGPWRQGIFSVSIRSKNERWHYSNRRIMITDLGILARMSDDHLMVWVNSLENLKPVNQAWVRLISANNQLLLEGKTNSEGVVLFEAIGPQLAGFTPLVITVNKDSDMSYLKFADCALPTAEYDISGRPFLARGYETFIYSDRGVYRPAETAHLVSVVRGKNGMMAEEFPYLLYVTDPQGYEFKKYKLNTASQGIATIDVEIPSFAKTGTYSIAAKINEEVIGQYSFQVEEFMPDRIKTTMALDKTSYMTGDTALITVNGTYLFGTPCEGNQVNGKILIEQNILSPAAFPGYTFADEAKQFTSVAIDLQSASLDESGNYTYLYQIPANLYPPANLKMLISGTVLEDGGRAVSDYKSAIIHPYPIYLGLNKNFQGYAKAGDEVEFSVTAVDPDGNFRAVDAVWVRLQKIIYQTIVKKDVTRRDKREVYRYVSEEEEVPIDSVLISLAKAEQKVRFTPKEYGRYRVRLESPRTGHISTTTFYVSGWGYSPWAMTNPDRLGLELDRDVYRAGQKARLLVKAPFEGKLLLTIEQDKVLKYQTYDLDSNTAEIQIDVPEEYTPNVYISGTLIKSVSSLERFSPSRAFGIVPLVVINDQTRLAVKLEAPLQVRPGNKIEVKIKTVPQAVLTVAAVDVGILQLTDYATPDPFDFFYGKRRLTLNAYDIYSFIFPDIKAGGTMLSAAGDENLFEQRRKRHVSPITSKRVKPVALWSGLVRTDSLGIASVSFDIPQFNGQIKVMAVGFADSKCGSADADIIVKDKILIQESLPRFLTSDDEIDARTTVFNNTGIDDTIFVTIDITGAGKLKSDKVVRKYIAEGEKETVHFKIKAAKNPGQVVINIAAAAGDSKSTASIQLPNRPPQGLQTKHASGIARQGQPAKFKIPSDWLEGTGEYQLRISSMPAVQFSNSIQYLLSYPYGCLEQTTSKLFPMLYYDDLARFAQPELIGSRGMEYFIQEGLIKITGMQLASGGFSYWPNSSSQNEWTSIYACHFMVEARKAGYYINDSVFDKIFRYLKGVANDTKLENNRGVLRIYAAYVLALANKLDRGTLEGLKYLNLDVLPLYSKFMYGGAIALMKSPQEALWLIPVEVQPVNFEPETGNFFDSPIRANAILLEILTELAPNNPSIPVLMESISEQLRIGRWYTTQSTAWGLMAIGKYLRKQEKANYTGSITIAGKRYKDFGLDDLMIKDKILASGDIEIAITGTGNCYYYWQSSGVAGDAKIQEYDDRLMVRREYLDANGNPLGKGTLKTGDQVVAKITATAKDKNLDNVVIDDLLPACFEIENPRLATSGRLEWVQDKSSSSDYLDIRDDRLLLFASLQQGRQFTYYYSMRVICAGEFMVPPVSAECMYDPLIKSSGSSGAIEIEE